MGYERAAESGRAGRGLPGAALAWGILLITVPLLSAAVAAMVVAEMIRQARAAAAAPVAPQRVADAGLAAQVAANSARLAVVESRERLRDTAVAGVAGVMARHYSAEGLPVPEALVPAADTTPLPTIRPVLHLAAEGGHRVGALCASAPVAFPGLPIA